MRLVVLIFIYGAYRNTRASPSIYVDIYPFTGYISIYIYIDISSNGYISIYIHVTGDAREAIDI